MSTFVMKDISLTEEARKKNSLQFSPKIKQIQASWKGRVDILKSLKAKSILLEDKKSAIFFKVVDAINELEAPPLI